MKSYDAPTVKALGSLRDLTLEFNKPSGPPDIYSSTVPVVGSLVLIP